MLTAVGPLSVDMYLPSLPTIARDLNTSSAAAGITLTVFLISLAIGQLIYGPASDRFGRKPPLYIGLAMYVAASIGCAFAKDATMLAVLRGVQGFGGCAGMVIARAAVRDRMDPAGAAQAYSTLMLVMGVAPILAPMIGGAVLQVGSWRIIFALLTVFGVLALAAVHYLMRETLAPEKARKLAVSHVLRDYWELLRDHHYAAYMWCGAVFLSGMFAYITVSSFVLIDEYGLSPSHYAWVFGSNAAGMIAASRLNVRLVRKYSPARVLRRALVDSGRDQRAGDGSGCGRVHTTTARAGGVVLLHRLDRLHLAQHGRVGDGGAGRARGHGFGADGRHAVRPGHGDGYGGRGHRAERAATAGHDGCLRCRGAHPGLARHARRTRRLIPAISLRLLL